MKAAEGRGGHREEIFSPQRRRGHGVTEKSKVSVPEFRFRKLRALCASVVKKSPLRVLSAPLRPSLREMVEAVFFAVAGNPEFKLGAISFRPFADYAAVESFLGKLYSQTCVSGCPAPPGSENFVCRRREENKIVQEQNQDGCLGAQGTP